MSDWVLVNSAGQPIFRNESPEYLRGMRDGLVTARDFPIARLDLEQWKVEEAR